MLLLITYLYVPTWQQVWISHSILSIKGQNKNHNHVKYWSYPTLHCHFHMTEIFHQLYSIKDRSWSLVTTLFFACVCLVTQSWLRLHGLYPARLLCPWNLPGKNTGVGCHALLQGIFPTQGLKQVLPHGRFFIRTGYLLLVTGIIS